MLQKNYVHVKACHGTFENKQFSRCQVFPKYYLQRPIAMVDRRNTGNFYASFHSKFLCTMGPKSFLFRLHFGQFTSPPDAILHKMSWWGNELRLHKTFKPIVSSLTKQYFIFHKLV